MTHDPTTAATLAQLLDTWDGWSRRDTLAAAIATLRAQGRAATALSAALAHEPVVDPLDALAPNDELVRLLSGWQWHAVRAACGAGASWVQIGAAAGGKTAERARADYLAQIERSERPAADITDTGPFRAVLDEPESTTSTGE
jgi:hypothetical protein